MEKECVVSRGDLSPVLIRVSKPPLRVMDYMPDIDFSERAQQIGIERHQQLVFTFQKRLESIEV